MALYVVVLPRTLGTWIHTVPTYRRSVRIRCQLELHDIVALERLNGYIVMYMALYACTKSYGTGPAALRLWYCLIKRTVHVRACGCTARGSCDRAISRLAVPLPVPPPDVGAHQNGRFGKRLPICCQSTVLADRTASS